MLAEARFYLQRGALPEAEAALAECSAKAPRDAGVVALPSQLKEAKAIVERKREIQPPHVLEAPSYPQPKTNSAATTAMFNPAAAVADLTPPAGTPISPEDVDSAISRTAASEVSLSATVLFEAAAAEPAPAAEPGACRGPATTPRARRRAHSHFETPSWRACPCYSSCAS